MSELNDFLNADDEDEPAAPLWMVTFSDLVTLLLTFFVLIVSMSSLEVEKFREALSYFQSGTGVLSQSAVVPPAKPEQDLEPRTHEHAERYQQVLQYLEEAGLEDKVQINFTLDGLHVMITDSVMFRSGDATLIEPSRTILSMIGDILGRDAETVVVEGHTDDRPINTPAFPSNWELSGSRAASVIRYLSDQPNALSADRYMAVGYGEHHPIDTNDTPEGRARNRRVEILFNWEEWQETPTPNLPRRPTTE